MSNSTQIFVPGYQFFLLPFLKVISDGQTKHMKNIVDEIIKETGLTEEQTLVRLPKQSDTLVGNRIGWARTYLYKAGLINQVSRGNYNITKDGLNTIKEKPNGIDTKYLKTLVPFQNWLNSFGEGKSSNEVEKEIADDESRTPQEILDTAYNTIMADVAFELLDKVKKSSPAFFETLVVDVLMAMGYGGFDESNGQVTQYSGDGGIDGIIKEDKLGLDTIYIQAKRWENSVTISAVRDFAGSLLSKKARKGVFITTSSFPQSAYEYVKSIDPTIILIDGVQLTKLMIEYNVAVSKSKTYEIKKIDNDYFEI
jgi:restriction system protein